VPVVVGDYNNVDDDRQIGRFLALVPIIHLLDMRPWPIRAGGGERVDLEA